jgi:hypothetical protein
MGVQLRRLHPVHFLTHRSSAPATRRVARRLRPKAIPRVHSERSSWLPHRPAPGRQGLGPERGRQANHPGSPGRASRRVAMELITGGSSASLGHVECGQLARAGRIAIGPWLAESSAARPADCATSSRAPHRRPPPHGRNRTVARGIQRGPSGRLRHIVACTASPASSPRPSAGLCRTRWRDRPMNGTSLLIAQRTRALCEPLGGVLRVSDPAVELTRG